MTSTPFQRLIGSTRVGSCASSALPRAIARLTEELGTSSNAVRGQLAILERDGLIRRTVARQVVGKLAHLFEATIGGRRLLSRAYEPALSAILSTLAERMPPAELDAALREAGHRLGLPPARVDAE